VVGEGALALLAFIVKRVLSAIPVILVVMILMFFVMRIIPGDPASLILGEEATIEDIENLRERMGLNRPLMVQFVTYIRDLLSGNWGNSYYNGRPVFENILKRLEPTSLIVLYSTIISVGIGIPLGIMSARFHNTVIDYTFTTVSVFGLSVPMFWFGVMIMFFFSVRLRWFPVQGYRTAADVGLVHALRYLTLPSVAVGLQHVASITRYTRSMMLEVISNNYIRTAYAKGLSERIVFYKHALKNALSPVVTTIGFSMAGMLGGTVVIEMVFNIPGMGKLAYDSLMRRDYTQEQAIILFMTIVFVVVNIVMDIIYKWLDPRIEID
jgi:peptide/nickel transport system permease protein